MARVTYLSGMANPSLPRVLPLRDVVLFDITAIVGLRHLQTASQFGPASIVLWLIAMVVFFLPSAAAVRELAEIDPRTGGLYRWSERAFGQRHGFLAGWSYWVSNIVYFPALLVSAALGKPRAPLVAYTAGVRSRWFWGDVDHLLARLRRSRGALSLPPGTPGRWAAIRDFFTVDRRADREEILRRDDPRPFFRETVQWLSSLR